MAGVNAREQRLRKQAELQSLTGVLAALREQEESYITAQALIPARLTEHILKVRQDLEAVEAELITLEDESIDTPARRLYQQGFVAEQNDNAEEAIRFYRQAVRQNHAEAQAAIRSLRYLLKSSGSKGDRAFPGWSSTRLATRSRFPFGVIAALLIFVMVVILILNSFLGQPIEPAVVIEVTAALTLTPTFLPPAILIPNTATLVRTPTSTAQPATVTPTPVPPAPVVVISPTPPPTPLPTPSAAAPPPLKAAPSLIGPKDNLVWGDGTIVFEFENLSLPENELYCLDTLRGYDATLTENWSFPATGSKMPRIPIEANVFRIAKLQDIQCIIWSAYIGRDSCDTVVSEFSEVRTIGLPRPCPSR